MRKSIIGISIVLSLVISFSSSIVYARFLNYHIISFQDDPIKIQKVEIREIEEEYGSKIRCKVTIKNGPRPVKAFATSFMFYDVFNEHLSTHGGVYMSGTAGNQEGTFTWEFDPYKGWIAYTVIVYLSQVRFGDHSVWRQEGTRLSDRIIEVTDLLFKAEQLKEKKE